MKILTMSLAAYGAAVALTLSPWGSSAQAQVHGVTVPAAHGDWTLGQREDWLSARIEQARADGNLTAAEYEHARADLAVLRADAAQMRASQAGELTPNQTRELEARLDTLSDHIHWANMAALERPW